MKLTLPELIAPTPQVGGCTEKKVTVPHFWKGGTYGAAQEWQQPTNWYNYHVPSWSDKVVIPGNLVDDCHYPVIDHFVSDIAQLIIEPGARLVVSRLGRLTVDGLGKNDVGILNEGELIVEGELTICRTILFDIENKGFIQNRGSIAFDQPFVKMLGQWEGLGELLFLG